MILAIFMVLGSVAQADSQARSTQTLDDFHQAAARADIDSYFAAMTEDVVFLGTDGSERWQGQAFRDFVRVRFAAGRGWTYTVMARNITIADDGQTAWFDESLHNEGLGFCRSSGVLVKSGMDWKIAQYNLSVPVPNAIVHEVVADITATQAAVVGSSAATVDAAVDDTMSGFTAGASAPPAAAADPVASEPAVEATETTDNCRRKRFKTNRKAGC
ncbi:MAG: DUF4440 domain-containing protein [Gammaproteobacteria bacterium]|nr:MAG: DUF4440 domain-containing protein [Gammaproteobacteria bacterium]RLA62412.1 MAG: DUF4440 domain-containing protein [Gammaproteobacteria bacterium]